jgi:hypothetical protein
MMTWIAALKVTPAPPNSQRGYAYRTVKSVLRADQSYNLDLLVGKSGAVVTRKFR